MHLHRFARAGFRSVFVGVSDNTHFNGQHVIVFRLFQIVALVLHDPDTEVEQWLVRLRASCMLRNTLAFSASARGS